MRAISSGATLAESDEMVVVEDDQGFPAETATGRWRMLAAVACVGALALAIAPGAAGEELPPLPTVTGISPDLGLEAGGTVVTVTGTGFEGEVSAVDFGSFAGVSSGALECWAGDTRLPARRSTRRKQCVCSRPYMVQGSRCAWLWACLRCR